MKSIKKTDRILAVMLVLCMIFGFAPAGLAKGGEQALEVLSNSPVGENVDVAENVSVTLSVYSDAYSIDPESITEKIKVAGADGDSVEGNISINKDTITFTPSENFKGGTVYNVTIGEGIRDTKGLVLENPYSWSFKTKAARTGNSTYYAAVSEGPDTGAEAGSIQNPYTSLETAIGVLEPGDTLILTEGEYTQPLVVNNKKGTAKAPITILGQGNVKINAGYYCRSPFWNNAAVGVIDSEFITVSNISFGFSGYKQEPGDAFTALFARSSNILVKNCSFEASGGVYTPMRIEPSNPGLVLDGCRITGGGGGAFYQPSGLSNLTLVNSIVYGAWAINMGGSGSKNIISNNIFTGGEALHSGTYANSVIANNVFAGDNTLTVGENTVYDYNCYTWGSPVGRNDISANASDIFVDADNGDYRLKEGSPCIGAGSPEIYSEYDYNGSPRTSPVDIGIYAYGHTYYVAPGGDDSAKGSKEAPFATFGRAIEAVKAADGPKSLMVKGGEVYTTPLNLDNLGSEGGDKIVVKSYDGIATLSGTDILTVKNSWNVEVSGFAFTSAERYKNTVKLLGAKNCKLYSCSFSNTGSDVQALSVGEGTSGTEIYNNDFNISYGRSLIMGKSSGNKIYNNVFNSYYGLLNEGAGAEIQDTLITNNTFNNDTAWGYSLSIQTASTGNTIQNNIFTSNLSLNPASVKTENVFRNNLYSSEFFTSDGQMAGRDNVRGSAAFSDAGDFHLTAGSDALNSGIPEGAPSSDKDGNPREGAVDIGAYEYISSSADFKVSSKSPSGASESASRDVTKLQIQFTEALKPDINLSDYITVSKEDGTPVPVNFEAAPKGAGVLVTGSFQKDLDYSTVYMATVSKSIQNSQGKTLNTASDITWSFTTEVRVMDTYYIAENGKDSNDGTIGSPKKNASSLVGVLKAGDTVIFRGGTYNGIIVLQSKQGTEARPITFKSYPGEKVMLTSDNPDYIFYLGHCKNIHIEGFTFAPTPSQGSSRGNAMYIDNHTEGYAKTSGIKVTKSTFINCGTAISMRNLKDIDMGSFELSNNVIYANDSWALYFQEVRVEDGQYGKVFNNVIYNANYSLRFFGRSKNILFYNNTFADVYDEVGGSGQYDIYPVQGSYTPATSPVDIPEKLVFKNNIFTKPIRTQLENGKSIIDASQNCIFDNNVYASNSMKSYVTYNGAGTGPVLTLEDLKSGDVWEKQGRGLEAEGAYADVAFVNPMDDARVFAGSDRTISISDDEIVEGVSIPETDINGNLRKQKEAGAYAYNTSLAFVGAYDGEDADGTLEKPYASLEKAIEAGATEIQVKAGTYGEAQTVSGKAKITPYGGEVVIKGDVVLEGDEDSEISLAGITLEGKVSIRGKNVKLESCRIDKGVVLESADGTVVNGNIFSQAGVDAVTLNNAVNSVITNNVLVNGKTALALVGESSGNVVYNNTFYGNTADIVVSEEAEGNKIKNNIISTLLDAGAYEKNEFGYNLYNKDTIAGGDFSNKEGTALYEPANFVNAKAQDYRLHRDSACVGGGISDTNTPLADINGVARGSEPDIGAYAYVAVKNSYYVDGTEGDDGNAGTRDLPFKTIGEALRNLRYGESIVIKAGAYDEGIVMKDRIAEEPDTYIIKAEGEVLVNGSVILEGADGITLEGITVNAGNENTAVKLAGSSLVKLNSVSVSGAKQAIEVVDCTGLYINNANIEKVDYGILLNGANNPDSRVEISGTRVDAARVLAVKAVNGVKLTFSSSIISNSEAGILAANEPDIMIVNNTFYNNRGYSIDVTQENGNGTELGIYNNIFSRSGRGQGAFTSITKEWGFYSEFNLYDAGADDAVIHMNGQDRNFAQVVEGGDETMGRLGYPGFKDAEKGDLKLSDGSDAARTGGKKVGDDVIIPAPALDFDGKAYSKFGQDIGAYYTPFSGQVIHLAATSKDSLPADGSVSNPYRTFRNAVENLDVGGKIIVHSGKYIAPRFDIVDKHGDPEAHCVIMACQEEDCALCEAGYERPVFAVDKTATGSTDRECFTKITNSSYIDISGIEIEGFEGAGIWTYDSENLTLSDLTIHDIDKPGDITSGVQGILVNGTKDALFKDIIIWNIGQTRKSQADHGMYLGGVENITIDSVVVHNSPGGGLQFYAGDNYKIHAKNCTIKNSVFSEAKYGLILCGTDNFNIVNNTFHNNWFNDIYMDWTVTNLNFYNNVFYNDLPVDTVKEEVSSQGKAQYNVSPTIIGRYGQENEENRVKGNVFGSSIYEYRTFEPKAWDGRNKIYPIKEFVELQNASGANSFENFRDGIAGFTDGTIDKTKSAAEQVAQLVSGILMPSEGSDCVDAGSAAWATKVDILGQPRDAKPDIGAYEYVSAEPPEIVISNNTIRENNAPGATVGKLEVKYPRGVYGFRLSDGHADNRSFVIEGDVLKARVSFDYEARSSYTVKVEAVSESGGVLEKIFIVYIGDEDENSSEPQEPAEPSNPSGPSEPSKPSEPSNPAEPEEPSKQVFSDTEEHWADDVIGKVARAGIIKGYGDGTFKPDNDATRAEFITLAVRMLGLENKNAAGFKDVAPGEWYAGAIAAAQENGLIKGRPDGSFGPDDSIKREEAMVVVSNILKILKVEPETDERVLDKFTDKDSISPWAREHVANLVGLGIVSGADNKLNPGENITRAEICVIIEKIMSGFMEK